MQIMKTLTTGLVCLASLGTNVALSQESTTKAADTDKKITINLDKLRVGVGFNYNRIDNSSLSSAKDGKASGSQVFFGYALGNRYGTETSIEAGYIKSGELYDNSDIDVNGFWGSAVVRKPLPEIREDLSAIARIGVGLKGDDGLFVGIGAQYDIHPNVFVRLEYLNKDLTQSYQANLGFSF
ncbi:porin family protein [Bermanella marisrubri]|uniref:Outer membrane protein beta-barrel domain-containing protein n=1 Tax=Bermanella marisrubri TaxID=207949 RepID=Q1MZV3_9GAMM|nr:outer membrane beta-barrel protein [Bermanella marisrubri]EAT11454.1 hypothetical protein RED65_04585 [Oceanobacter sp. RED65] [Bermanella marisrubri]QIZ85032.1 porin family protein [Bermanella marisrubri]